MKRVVHIADWDYNSEDNIVQQEKPGRQILVDGLSFYYLNLS